jgi:hypothetical protein
MNLLSSFLQCGAFILIPLVTFALGIWKISQIDEKYHRLNFAALIGFVFFEASMIGMLIDPRSSNHPFIELILIALATGIFTFLFVLLMLPILRTLKK